MVVISIICSYFHIVDKTHFLACLEFFILLKINQKRCLKIVQKLFTRPVLLSVETWLTAVGRWGMPVEPETGGMEFSVTRGNAGPSSCLPATVVAAFFESLVDGVSLLVVAVDVLLDATEVVVSVTYAFFNQ